MLFFRAYLITSPADLPTDHGLHLVEHTIIPNNISTLFSKAPKKFEPISGHPMDSHLAELCEVLSQILLVIPYNKGERVHNLVWIIQAATTYTSDCTSAFPRPNKPAIYDEFIKDNEKAPVHARKDKTHKALRRNYTASEAADREAGKFILGVVEYTWVQEIKRSNN